MNSAGVVLKYLVFIYLFINLATRDFSFVVITVPFSFQLSEEYRHLLLPPPPPGERGHSKKNWVEVCYPIYDRKLLAYGGYSYTFAENGSVIPLVYNV